jgi:hypothetical protein
MIRTKISLALTFLQFIFSPVAVADGPKKIRAAEEAVVPTGVIFSEKASERNGLCSRPSTCWLPSAADVAALEKGLSSYLLTADAPSAKRISKNLPAYGRKYFGYKKDGDRWIVMIGLCARFWHPSNKGFESLRPPGTDLEECYFSASYNVDKGKFEDLYVDGETS